VYLRGAGAGFGRAGRGIRRRGRSGSPCARPAPCPPPGGEATSGLRVAAHLVRLPERLLGRREFAQSEADLPELVDHIIPLKPGGCDGLANMQWQHCAEVQVVAARGRINRQGAAERARSPGRRVGACRTLRPPSGAAAAWAARPVREPEPRRPGRRARRRRRTAGPPPSSRSAQFRRRCRRPCRRARRRDADAAVAGSMGAAATTAWIPGPAPPPTRMARVVTACLAPPPGPRRHRTFALWVSRGPQRRAPAHARHGSGRRSRH
jgi:hypothetical protein